MFKLNLDTYNCIIQMEKYGL